MSYPNNRHGNTPPYLLSAYGIAVKHGYSGTEEEWLASLKGDQGEYPRMQFDSETGYLQIRYDDSGEWTDIASLAALMTESEEAVVASAKEYADTAEAYAKGTVDGEAVEEGDSGYEDNAKYYAGQASTYASAAGGFATGASNYAQAASGYATTASGHADNAAASATAAAGSASDAAGSATSASNSAGSAATSALSAQAQATQAGTYAYNADQSAQAAANYAASANAAYGAVVTAANNASTSASAASTSAEQAASYLSSVQSNANKAEAYAAGTRGGTPVESGDEAYHNNAAYYAGLASDAQTAAEAAAETAATEAAEDAVAAVSATFDSRYAPISAVGSPLTAATVAGMTDQTKVYVYTGSETGYTSGNWYYYNGSAWTSGGVYNSTAFETDTTLAVSGAAADAKKVGDELTDLKSAITYLVVEDSTTYIPADGTHAGTEITAYTGYIDTNGATQGSISYRTTDYIEIDAYAKLYADCYGLPTILNVAFYNSNKTFISGIGAAESWGRISGNLEVPQNAKYIRVCLMNANASGYITVTIAHRYSTIENAALKTELAEIYIPFETSTKVGVADVTGDNGYIDSTGKLNSSLSWKACDYINICDAVKLSAYIRSYDTVPIFCFYDKYKTFIGSTTVATAAPHTEVAVFPSGTYYCRINFYVSDTVQYYIIDRNPTKTAALNLTNALDKLYGKKLGAIGDSITIGTHSVPGNTYIDQIARAHSMTVDNQAIWGSVFPTDKTLDDNPRGSIYSQVASLSSDCDAVIISGGINDADYYSDSTYWGEISGGYSATLDTTTFCGAFEGTLKAALDKFKGKPILFVFEHRMTQTYQSTFGEHFEEVQYPLMVEMLQKWGIPYVDLFHDMPSIKLTPDYIALYSFDNQGVHPNIAGYRKFYVPRVESALEAIAV